MCLPVPQTAIAAPAGAPLHIANPPVDIWRGIVTFLPVLIPEIL
jgi:hypothetical protein